MITDRIAQIEATLQNAQHLPDATRSELVRLLNELKAEVVALQETHGEHAEKIAHYTDASIQGVTRSGPDEGPDQPAIKSLTDSVAELETSHPQLVQVVNRIALTLSNMGI